MKNRYALFVSRLSLILCLSLSNDALAGNAGSSAISSGKKETALIQAVRDFNKKKIIKFLEERVDPNGRNENWETPLHVAATLGYLEILKTFKDYGANFNRKDKNGETPLHRLVSYKGLSSDTVDRSVEMIQTLVKFGAQVNERNKRGETPHFIVARLYYDCCKSVLRFFPTDEGSEQRLRCWPFYTLLETLEKNGAEAQFDNAGRPPVPIEAEKSF